MGKIWVALAKASAIPECTDGLQWLMLVNRKQLKISQFDLM